jgi:ribosome-associated heat shock protein Hsp15
MSKVRIDKWLWSVRIFKSRSISTDAVKSGKVKINDKNAKPSTLITEGEVIQVRKNGFEFLFQVVTLIEKRVGAPIAITCYENVTSEEEMNKYKSWFIGKAQAEVRDRGMGRPTKKERREIDEYKTDLYWFEEDDEEL